MSESRVPDSEPGGREALLAALQVPRYARLAVVIGAVVTLVVTLFFLGLVAGWAPGDPAAYYVGLAFVVFVSTTLLAASVLTLRRVLSLVVHPASIVRRAATVGLLGGLCWLGVAGALAASALAGDGLPVADAVAGIALPWAPLLCLGGVWALQTRYKRETPVRPVAVIGAVIAIPSALVLAALAARELSVLLATPPPPGTQVPDLFVVASAGLSVGHALQAIAVVLGGLHGRSVGLVVAPLLGLAGLLAAGPSPVGIAALAAGHGLGWLFVTLALRRVADAAVPAGRDPFEAAGD